MGQGREIELGSVLTSRVTGAVVCALALIVPVMAVDYPPIVDLPQQLGQVRLFFDALGGGRPDLEILWATPNKLAYVLLAGFWLLSPSVLAGRLAILALGVLWVGGFHLLARRRDRDPAVAVLVSLLFFHHSVYWGFLSFVVGVPVFLLWLHLMSPRREPRAPWKEALLTAGCALLLYYAHALWLAAGLGWMALTLVLYRPRVRVWLPRIAGALPLVLVAVHWWFWLKEAGFSSATMWRTMPWERLAPDQLVDGILGGLQGPVESIAVVVLLVWALAALGSNWGALRERSDGELLLAGALFFLGGLVLPHRFSNTIFFAERWMPVGVALLLLGLPPLRLRPVAKQLAALVFVLGFCLYTTAQWIQFEVVDLAGLPETVEAVPEDARILGLAFVRKSETVKARRPFIQTYAYAEAERGAELNFSFADFSSGLVHYAPPREQTWTNGLEWYPERVTDGDFRAFTHVIMAGGEDVQTAAGNHPLLTPLTRTGLWRLYRVESAR